MFSLTGCLKKLTLFVVFLATPASLVAQTLPEWIATEDQPGAIMNLDLPRQLKFLPETDTAIPRFLFINLAPDWQPEWQKAAFDMKALIVAMKTRGPNVRVGLSGASNQIDALMQHELAAYVDGYLFEEEPYIPDADETGKLWQRVSTTRTKVMTNLVEASSLGIQLVVFENLAIDRGHRDFLAKLSQTQTGSLDLQPQVTNLPQDEAQFFFQPETGYYHLAVYGDRDEDRYFYFNLAEGVKTRLLYPEKAKFRGRQFGKRTELRLTAGEPYFLFQLEPAEPLSSTETLKIVEKKSIDPYELVVKNQVFKDREAKKFKSLEVDELQNYRYQTPTGATIDVTFNDTVVERVGMPVERIRRELYIGGAKWPYKKLPELPLIQPEKVQSEPLVIDFDKSYEYTYLGEANVNDRAAWKVGFKPRDQGDYFSGTVWIDKENGAHLKIRALQSGLEPPVVGNELIVFYGWVSDNGEKYWIQNRESSLQVLSVVGERISLQIDSQRENYRFNRPDLEENLAAAYLSEVTILRDTAKGFRYLTKKGDTRELREGDLFTSQRLILGGIFYDPGLDSPIPLGGFNYTSLDFFNTGYQANFFVAGAVNDLILSNPDFLGKGWDLTAELFISAIEFGDSIYENGEERNDLEVSELRESFNLSLGIPISSFFKVVANYGLRYRKYDDADETNPDFVIPSTHFENIFRLAFQYDRRRFSSELQYEMAERSEWEAWGLPDNTDPLEDKYSTLQFDASLSKRFKGFQDISSSVRYLKGWDQDRFSRFEFGFFDNTVSGFGTSGIEATEAVRLRLGYEVGVKGLFQLDFSLDGARTWLENRDPLSGTLTKNDPIDLYGIGLAANFIGPWKTVMRLNVGYGLDSDLEAEAGNFTGQLVFLRLF